MPIVEFSDSGTLLVDRGKLVLLRLSITHLVILNFLDLTDFLNN